MVSIAALLTIIGYSMNEKVITFDRLRENLRKYKTTPLRDVINKSENERLSRTLITGTTAILALAGKYGLLAENRGNEVENLVVGAYLDLVGEVARRDFSGPLGQHLDRLGDPARQVEPEPGGREDVEENLLPPARRQVAGFD